MRSLSVKITRASLVFQLLRLLLGALGGLVATGPMSVAMILLHRQLPRKDRHPLPPREISVKAAHKVTHDLDGQTKSLLTVANHFAYGAAAGTVYSLTTGAAPGHAVRKGVLFGLAVWAVSYLGILPGLGVLKPATQISAPRNALMIAVHLVWGLCLSFFVDVLLRDSAQHEGALAGQTDQKHPDAA